MLLIVVGWPRDGATAWQDNPSGLNFKQAMAEIARPFVLSRLLLLGAINSAGVLYMVLVSLIFDAATPRGASDVALYVGLIAGWEVPFLLLLPRLTTRISRSTLIAAGAAIIRPAPDRHAAAGGYALYLGDDAGRGHWAAPR